jgi:RimK-like ATP-grasp domain
MRIFFIYKKNAPAQTTLILLEKAALALGLQSVAIAIEDFDFTTHTLFPQKGDALYRIATGERACAIERFLLTDEVATLYQKNENAYFYSDDLSLYRKHSLPTPKTLPYITPSREALERDAAFVGGFPLIIKTLGKSHGLGVNKVENLDELASLLQDEASLSHTVLKEFIPHKKHARLIVLGNKVIDSISYLSQGAEFRTNVGENILVEKEIFPAEVEKIAIKAVTVSGWEFGGVDMLIHEKTGAFYLAEVNFPCFFPRAQALTGVDIAKEIVLYLKNKSLKTLQD